MIDVKHIKDNQYKIEHENGSVYLDAESKEQALEIYNANYTPLHDKKGELLSKAKSVASKLLQATDYKVIRHRDQLELIAKGEVVIPALSSQEYEDLLKERNDLRDWSNEKEAEINEATTIEELKQIKVEY